MLNFTVGPVMAAPEILKISGEQVPYFRTGEFSKLMLENEKMMIELSNAPAGSRCVFLTGSGTAAMEAAVVNSLTKDDRALIVNGGSFGQRFTEICKLHKIAFDEIRLEIGECLDAEKLSQYDGSDYTSFIVNMHETSTGVLYDMELISKYCRDNNLFLIVDGISSFLADPLDIGKWGVDMLIVSSQKAMACNPGISMILISEQALKRVEYIDSPIFYLDLKDAILNAERGQTPFTPAVGTLLQIHRRLEMAINNTAEGECRRVAEIAKRFRDGIEGLPLEYVSQNMSNAVTALHPINMSAKKICDIMKDEYSIWLCPNGGDMADYMFRVGHIGYIKDEDISELLLALKSLLK